MAITKLQGVDDQRLGAAFRAVRVRRGWTQKALATRCDVSASLISLIERGHWDTLAVRSLRRVAAALDIRIDVTPRIRTGDIERLLNSGHAHMHEKVAQLLVSLPGWVHAPEVSFAVFSERGVIDILAFHAQTGALLIIELKTELVSFEDLFMNMDVRMRHASRIAAGRGWQAHTVSCWVVVAETTPNRRRVAEHRTALRSAFPATGRQLQAWLRAPSGAIRALSFLSISSGGGAKLQLALCRRVRSTRWPAAAA